MSEEPPTDDGPEELSPGKKRRLKLAFTHGMKMSSAGNYDYAVDMFCQCVSGDPSNVDYIKQLTSTLHKKFNDNKKGDKMASMKTMGPKAAVKKCSVKKDWKGIFKPALEVLKVNPWDVPTLLELATACENLKHEECELAWLRAALDHDMKDATVNKRAGLALERQKHYDQAIMCWRRVEQAQPDNEEARKKIGQLSVERTINKGGLDTAEKASQTKTNLNDPDKKDGLNESRDTSGGGQGDPEEERKTPEQMALDTIKENPADAGNYLHLAELYLSKSKFEEAENVLKKGLEATAGDFKIVERLEDAQVERRQNQLEAAKQKAQKQPTDDNKLVVKKIRNELNKFELDVYRSRSDREPQNTTLAAELGMRLERCGQFKEAITAYQRARNDADIKGRVLMGLGRCFIHIKQNKLGMNHFVEACEVITEPGDDRKEALYLAGKLALQISDLDKANAYLGELAGVDFGYKDVADLLDKLNEMDDTE